MLTVVPGPADVADDPGGAGSPSYAQGAGAGRRARAEASGLGWADVHAVTTHNPFAVNDLWFHQQTGYSLERMNVLGSSLIYGHPQAPTGLRLMTELEVLVARGGGIGLFTGCAAGDTGAAVVVRVDD